jgi:hypothetical protein
LLPSLDFSLPDGGVLPVNGTNAGVLTFENKSETVACYVWLGWAQMTKKMQSPQPRPSQPPLNSVLDTEKVGS